MSKTPKKIEPWLLDLYRKQAKELGPGPLQELIDHIDWQDEQIRKEREKNATTETNC